MNTLPKQTRMVLNFSTTAPAKQVLIYQFFCHRVEGGNIALGQWFSNRGPRTPEGPRRIFRGSAAKFSRSGGGGKSGCWRAAMRMGREGGSKRIRGGKGPVHRCLHVTRSFESTSPALTRQRNHVNVVVNSRLELSDIQPDIALMLSFFGAFPKRIFPQHISGAVITDACRCWPILISIRIPDFSSQEQ